MFQNSSSISKELNTEADALTKAHYSQALLSKQAQDLESSALPKVFSFSRLLDPYTDCNVPGITISSAVLIPNSMYCRFLTQSACRIRSDDLRTRQHSRKNNDSRNRATNKTEKEKPTSLPTLPRKKGKRKRSADFSTLHEARALLQDHSETEKELNLGSGSEHKRLPWRMHPTAVKLHKSHRARAARHGRPSGGRPPVDRSVRCVDGRFGKK
jgi:hypothetical protein